MNENSREEVENLGKTSRDAEEISENVEKTESKKVSNLIFEGESCSTTLQPSNVDPLVVSDRCGSSFDASGPSFRFPPPEFGESESSKDTEGEEERDSDAMATAPPGTCVVETRVSRTSVVVETCPPGTPPGTPVASTANIRPHVRIAVDESQQSEPRRNSIGPPPSYSFVMKENRKGQKSNFSFQSPLEIVTDRPPPPAYAGIRGLYTPQPLPPPEADEANRMCLLPSFSEPIWRSHSQPAFCPRCGILVLTTTHAHESVATHVAALTLCLFGCWPCCFLPYCMNVCKNTHHHCPVCQVYLGSYTPW